ncbi:ABC transporter permease [Nocardioides marinus]|jgi:phospholipid/cholesterol/gamma-HCH transport system permease protein|uniref:Phospholipid/cholesterol/gamma-HCH transport system permease protein n=1 Tax=Nocardioides marinus TaxID=374514 RepID=A0A7Y9YDA9_9ACTN|nr:ABC transporter permease [Nocardioides marinus]MBU2073722.1 ABC transporter permease [Actinomycetota bacterium]NYI10110.1 phospholipid/cholesterol/gamma-HCH transport system permease protein [Nocardioides marinus]
MAVSAASVVRGPGEIAAMVVDVTRRMFTTRFQLREFIEQAWFITSVTLMPTILVSIPFGAVISLQVGNLTGQLGAQSFAGATAVLAVVREAAPIAAALIIAGAAGSAICSDLGARKIREEIDAMEVLGVDPLARLVVPRVLATMFVALMINGIVIGAGIGGGYFFTVIIQGGSAGAFLSSFTALASITDLYISCIKAVVFGWLAAIVGAYKGLGAGGGPSGVGRAVNESVIIAFMLLFFLNAVITAIYFQVVPPPGL